MIHPGLWFPQRVTQYAHFSIEDTAQVPTPSFRSLSPHLQAPRGSPQSAQECCVHALEGSYHQWCWLQYLTPAEREEGDSPFFQRLAQTSPPSPAPMPVNTSDDNSQATGELCSCLLDDSFCHLPGGRASAILSAPRGWRMGTGCPCLCGWDSDLAGQLSIACWTIVETSQVAQW